MQEEKNSPYVFRNERESTREHDPEEREVVINEGRAMSFRSYRRSRDGRKDLR